MPDNVTGMVANWIVQTISATGYLGVSSLMALKSDAFRCHQKSSCHLQATCFDRTLQSLLGRNRRSAWLQYRLNNRLSNSRTRRKAAVEKWGSLLLMGPHELQRVDAILRNLGA